MTSILIVQSVGNESNLEIVLKSFGFEIEKVHELGDVLKKISSKKFDLVVGCDCCGDYDGFYIYKAIKAFLHVQLVPYFISLNRSVLKEKLMIVYEMGIDNVIFEPLHPRTIKEKIDLTLKKKSNVNLHKVSDFISFFNSSFTPTIWVRDNKIQSINNSFNKVFGTYSDQIHNQKLEHVFELEENESTRLTFYKFKHQVVNECYLNSIKTFVGLPCTFDLFFFRGRFSSPSEYLIELKTEMPLLKVDGGISEETNHSNELVLTSREKEVYKLSSKGLPLKIIAENLNISKRTVERHRANIMQKTNSSNILEAIAKINNSDFHNS